MPESERIWPKRTLRKLDAKLRMIVDGDTGVNRLRAQQCGAVRIADRRVAASVKFDTASSRGERRARGAPPEAPPLSELARGLEVSVLLHVEDGLHFTQRYQADRRFAIARGNQVIATVSFEELRTLSAQEDVLRVERGSALIPPLPLNEDDDTNAEAPDRTAPEGPHHGGRDVLIGIVDVHGFDFAHRDFLDGGQTRFVRIWDQGGEGTRPAPGSFGYGAEFLKAHLDQAIRAAPELGVVPEEIERQSQLVTGSHGTHVASIAAGNSGLCPNAKIAGVLIALTQEDVDRRRSFYDSSRLLHAVEYLFKVAELEGCKAVSINISLGTNGHAHDASDPVSRWLDSALVTPGRFVCVAAGNAGQERPSSDDDIGFVNGRIHTAGTFSAAGQSRDCVLRVVGNTIEDVSENEIEVWYSNRDSIAVEVHPPGLPPIGPVEPGESRENEQLADGTFVSIYSRLYHPANGDNVISVYLSPFFGQPEVRGVRPGAWKIRLIAREIRDGEYHGWIERDDPRPIIDSGPVRLWNFPSYFVGDSNVDERSISSLGCGPRVVAVANFDEAAGTINISSSQGPTRDARRKPDVAAPGTRIVAAGGFDPDRMWTSKTGTSMASPFVCGVAGLMLDVNPDLSAAQITGVLQRVARPLPGGGRGWHNDAGFGIIDAQTATDAVRAAAAVETI